MAAFGSKPGASVRPISSRLSSVLLKARFVHTSGDRYTVRMHDERIKLRTETGQLIDAVVLSKRPESIEVVIGEGIHNVKCQLAPTRNGLAYAGRIMGREVIYERSRDQVQADIERLNPVLRKPRGR